MFSPTKNNFKAFEYSKHLQIPWHNTVAITHPQ